MAIRAAGRGALLARTIAPLGIVSLVALWTLLAAFGRPKNPQGHRYFPWRMCHRRDPGENSPSRRPRLGAAVDDEVEKKCRFCHKELPKPPRAHPAYIKPGSRVTVPPDLPLDRRGRIVCCTCHDPHPSVRTPYMVRRRKISQLCKSCHKDIGV